MKYNHESGQYEDETLAAGMDDEQALVPVTRAVSPAVTGELVKSGKVMTWGMIALAALILWPQMKRAMEKINR